MITRLLCTAVLVAAALVAPASAAVAATGYSATIRYTEYGIPHITAGSYGDAGFGRGTEPLRLNCLRVTTHCHE